MEIRENKVYQFIFPYENTDICLPVKAETRDEAIRKLQKFLSNVQTDLAMESPQVAPTTGMVPVPGITPGVVPPEVLEMRIDTLLGDMGAGELKGKSRTDTIKAWTGHSYEEKNFTNIIKELELIKTGQKEIPPHGKK